MIRQGNLFFSAIILFVFISVQSFAAVLEDVNYGFATYLGSGIYSAAGQDVQIYQIPFSYQIYDSKEKGYGLNLTLPVTLGFYDFNLSDIINDGFPEEISTFSFVPGLEFEYPVLQHWKLLPFFDLGVAENLSNGDASKIYAYGLRSYFDHPFKDFKFILGNRLLYVRQKRKDNSHISDFGAFETSLEFRFPQFPLFKKHLGDFEIYYANFQYFDSLDFLFPDNKVVTVIKQNEVGITFGVQIKKKTKYIDIPRIGLAIRKGDGLDIYRLVFGMPF